MSTTFQLYLKLNSASDIDPEGVKAYYDIIRRRSPKPGRPLEKQSKIVAFLKQKGYNIPYQFTEDPTDFIKRLQVVLDDFVLIPQYLQRNPAREDS